MGYELYLRRRDPAVAPPEAPALEQALRAAGAYGEGEALQLPAGGGRLAARYARVEGVLQGVDLEMPYGAADSDFRAGLLTAAELAARLDLILVDPQLGAEVTPGRAEDAVVSWQAANRYAVDMAGRVEDTRSALPAEPTPSAVGPRAKAMMIGLGVLVLAYLVMNWLISHIQAPLKPID